MGNRAVFALATIQILLFFLVANFDRYFFMLHFLASLIYLMILLLLFYGFEDWAYVIGFVTPLLWIVSALLSGTLGLGLRALGRVLTLQPVANPIDALSALLLVVGLLLMVASAWAFRQEVWGRPGAVRTAAWATVLVWIYYAALIAVMFRLSRPQG
ncbi:MAG: hypothetical protein ACE5HL_00215 [Terriglobia bacterium]